MFVELKFWQSEREISTASNLEVELEQTENASQTNGAKMAENLRENHTRRWISHKKVSINPSRVFAVDPSRSRHYQTPEPKENEEIIGSRASHC